MPRPYLGMRPGDLDGKRYARFWKPEMRPLPEHVRDALVHGPEAGELALPLDRVEDLLAPGDLPLETGIARLRDGRTLVAARTELPDATGAMFEWWMGWHYMEPQRYKLWHPRAHLSNGTREMRGDDPTLTDREKYLTTHYVTEYIGPHWQRIAIRFVEPSELLPPGVAWEVPSVTAMVCARIEMQQPRVGIGTLVHQVREVPGGSELRSRFWIGKPELADAAPTSLRNRALGSRLARRLLVPGDLAPALLAHCGMEMNHLAGFLPELYAEYH